MNRDQAKQLLPIIQAFADGKKIQFYQETTEQWEDVQKPAFSFAPSRYRIKPNKETVTYRIGIYRSKSDKKPYVIAAMSVADVREIESWDDFIRWIDPDWITEEVENKNESNQS